MIAIVILTSPVIASATTDPIWVTTCCTNLFFSGETVIIEGGVDEVLEGFPVTLQIVGPNGDVMTLAQLEVNQNKRFGTELTTGGPLWKEAGAGQYVVKVLYGSETRTAQATFDFAFDWESAKEIQEKKMPAPLGVDVRILYDDSLGYPNGFSFSPEVLTVKEGDAVTWYFEDSVYAHTVTSGNGQTGPDGVFDSGLAMPGNTFSHTFTKPGTYPYFCMVHNGHEGVIVVVEEHERLIPDTVPPLLLVPEDILVDATDNQGARVEYSVKSIDDVDGVLEPFCNPPSRHLFPIGDNVVTCQSFDSSGNNIKKSFIITVQNPPTFVIPDWVKDVAGFWCNNEIDDPSFIEAIQYLIENRVILVPISESGSGTSQIMPSWIKNNACWWSQGLISDDDFASGIEYLINQGIIIV